MNPDETKDPIMGGEAQDGTQYAPVEPTEPSALVEPEPTPEPTPEPKKDPVASVAERLSETGGAEKEDGVVREEAAIPFDITKLNRDQIQTLKAMLNATPDASTRKKQNPRIRLRRIDGQFVQDFKNAYLALVEDKENRREVERHVIPVQFIGSKEFTNVMYSRFINSEQVACEVIDYRQKVEEIPEGETISRQTGTLVEMVRKEMRVWYTVKLPDGSTVEIEGKVANA